MYSILSLMSSITDLLYWGDIQSDSSSMLNPILSFNNEFIQTMVFRILKR